MESITLPSRESIAAVEASEMDYQCDRMIAIRERSGNPEGVEIKAVGEAVCFYSRTMPWPGFNTVKGAGNAGAAAIDEILAFYREKERKPQFEIVPGLEERQTLHHLAKRGYYASGMHASLTMDLAGWEAPEHRTPRLRIEKLRESEIETYAAIHCRAFGLPEQGIPAVAANNLVLLGRPGWTFFIAYVEDRPAAAAVMYVKDRTASLTFAATLQSYRKTGLHERLLQRRFFEAKRQGCDRVVGQCGFLSASHRSMERAGMRIAYLRSSWTEMEE
ncbi:hypothetical protein PA598K_06177 [Paenibacillus sp. 598K]|uniref:GNAT family N-acetyltransferase n=1 Tax=Paenibacillus sp. 598K TaxID=1117987 RepID=UPI000FFA9A23|nr:GNAT family N-acetyltransferase [Paenibacillus sp. 598K]GBF77620.1 hypothetical protein PA598K_06177 [Paenibacillus sp. 598K]